MTDSSRNIGPMIAASARLSLGYMDRLLNGVTPETFARYASIGDTTIVSNHPCFIIGHLSLYPSRVVSELGGDASTVTPTDGFVKVFDHTAQCVDDVDGSVYPSMSEVVAAFRSGHEKAIEVLEAAEDAQFYPENPNERLRAKFPTIGAMHGFYMSGHMMMHVGQFSAWRRMMGLGPG